MVGNEAMKVRFEVTSVKAPILSLAAVLFSVVVTSPCRWTELTMSTGSSAWRAGQSKA